MTNSSFETCSRSLALAIGESRDVYEIQLQAVWNALRPGKTLRTTDGRRLEVVSTGTWNVEPGPDFLNAKLRLDGGEIRGDVEAHTRVDDWFHHGHDGDSAFENVALHVVVEADPDAEDRLGIPTVVLAPRKTKPPVSDARKFPNGRCSKFFAEIDDQQAERILVTAGLTRFRRKSEVILAEMIKSGSERTCLRLFFDALGYKKNRHQFVELHDRFLDYDESARTRFPDAIIWGESGLLPDPSATVVSNEMREFVQRTWRQWGPIRPTGRPKPDWVRSGVRPMNSPERRTAAAVGLIRQFGDKPLAAMMAGGGLAETRPETFWKWLKPMLIVSDPLWDRYSNFFDRRGRPAAVLGAGRALDLAVNVALPCLRALAVINDDEALTRFAEKAWLSLPATQSNRLEKIAIHRWFMPPSRGNKLLKTAAARQGTLFLYKSLCEREQTDCESCLLGGVDQLNPRRP